MKRLMVVMALVWAFPAQAFVEVEQIHTAGQTAWLAQDDTIPAFELQLDFVRAGSAYDPQGQDGLAMLAAEMLEEGTRDKDAAAFSRALERRAIGLSVSVNKETISVYLKSLSDERMAAFDLLEEMLTQPGLRPESLREVKQRMQVARLRQQESPGWHAQMLWWQSAFGNHPYARADVGTDESVAALGSDDLKQFYRDRLTKKNLRISIAGDITPMQVKVFLQKHLAASSLSEAFSAPVLPEAAWQPQGLSASHVMDVPQSVIRFGGPGIPRDDADFYAAFVFNQIVGGSSLTSALGEEIRKNKGYTYGINTDLQQTGEAALWMGGYATREDAVSDSLRDTKTVLNGVYEQGVSAAQVRQAKDYLTGSFPLQLDTNASLVGYLNTMQRFGLGADYLLQRNALLEAVSTEDVNRVARRLLNPAHLLYVVAGREGKRP
jgi:zinc protease